MSLSVGNGGKGVKTVGELGMFGIGAGRDVGMSADIMNVWQNLRQVQGRDRAVHM